MNSREPVRVVVLIGDEKQAKRFADVRKLVEAGADREVEVELIAPSWSRNWARPLGKFRRAVVHADAAVLGTFVPTELGAAARDEVRRLHVPHIRTSKLGRSGLAEAILAAVDLVEAA